MIKYRNQFQHIEKQTIRKRRFGITGSLPHKLPAHLLDVVQFNYDLWFYKMYRRNLSEHYFGKEEGSQLTESESN